MLHIDVNGTLALGDVAGTKGFGKMATSLAEALLRSNEEGGGELLPKPAKEWSPGASAGTRLLVEDVT